MSDDKERLMIDNAKKAEKAAGPKTMDKPADDHEVAPADATQDQKKKI